MRIVPAITSRQKNTNLKSDAKITLKSRCSAYIASCRLLHKETQSDTWSWSVVQHGVATENARRPCSTCTCLTGMSYWPDDTDLREWWHSHVGRCTSTLQDTMLANLDAVSVDEQEYDGADKYAVSGKIWLKCYDRSPHEREIGVPSDATITKSST